MNTPIFSDFGPPRGLRVRHEAATLARLVFDAAALMPRGSRGDLADQLRRAAGSVHANLAEGEGRRTASDRALFFQIAWASLREVEAHLALAQATGLLDPATTPALRAACRHVGRMLYALVHPPALSAAASPSPPVPSPPAPFVPAQ